MDIEKTILEVLKEMKIAQAMIDQGSAKYYNASKTLESLYSPASPKRAKKSILSPEQIAKLIYRKPKK